MGWLRKLLGLCQHKWQTEKVATIIAWEGPRQYIRGERYTLRCEHCGWVKHRNLY